MRERLLQYCLANKASAADSEEFVTAISEAFANAVEHAGALDPVVIDLRVDEGEKLVATITDDGRGFDAREVSSALPPAGAERGRGIPLMREYSDVFMVDSAPGQGTVVTLVRYIQKPHLEAARSESARGWSSLHA